MKSEIQILKEYFW